MFIDVSGSAGPIWEKGEKAANRILEAYQKQVRAVLESRNACFIEPGGGPQVVCCFENPVEAVLAADAVRLALREWTWDPEHPLHIQPCIGLHLGYIVYRDGLIHQSNTNNMAKRVQTQADPGQIFISPDMVDALGDDPRISAKFVRTANLKNIPEPQEIYEAVVLIRQAVPPVLPPSIEPVTPTPSPEKSAQPEAVKVERRTAHWVFVYIDVCESTKKFCRLGDRYAGELIRQYQQLCHSTFTACGCAYVSASEGDQIIAGFEYENADGAAVASIKILQGLFRRNVNVPQNQQVRVAIGIHAGEVILQGDEPVPTKDMRVGKALQSQATADVIIMSDKVYNLFSSDVQQHAVSFGTLDSYETQETVEMYNLQWVRVQLKTNIIPPKPTPPSGASASARSKFPPRK